MRSIPASYWLKFILLFVALGFTILCIAMLKGDKTSRFLNSLGFGYQGQRLNWCTNRVKSLGITELAGAKVTEENGKWQWQGKDTTTLNYLDVEKWFAKYCQLRIEKVTFSDFNSQLKPMIEVEFIKGDPITIFDLGDNRYQIQKHIFKSDHLRKGFKELLAFGPRLE